MQSKSDGGSLQSCGRSEGCCVGAIIYNLIWTVLYLIFQKEIDQITVQDLMNCDCHADGRHEGQLNSIKVSVPGHVICAWVGTVASGANCNCRQMALEFYLYH